MRVDREIRIHSTLAPHPGIVKLLSTFEDDNRVYMEMELLPGDLFKTLIERTCLDEEGAVLDVLIPLLEALDHLHGQVRRSWTGEALMHHLKSSLSLCPLIRCEVQLVLVLFLFTSFFVLSSLRALFIGILSQRTSSSQLTAM